LPWIESHTELPRHKKTKRFARQLGISIPTALGHLHLLWYWAWDYAKDGSLRKGDAEEIAEEAQWEGDPNTFFQALIDAGWIDEDNSGRRIHDWDKYGGKLLKKLSDDAERKREQRSKDKPKSLDRTGTSEGNPLDVQWTKEGYPQDVQRERRGEDIRGDNITGDKKTGSSTPPALRPPEQPSSPAIPITRSENPFSLFQTHGFGKLDVLTRDFVIVACEDYTDDWVNRAMKETVKQNKIAWSYVEKILKNWKETGHAEPWTLERKAPEQRGKSGKPNVPIVQQGTSRPMTLEEHVEMRSMAHEFDAGQKPKPEDIERFKREFIAANPEPVT
jgi:DnaD/phage-associated family protein